MNAPIIQPPRKIGYPDSDGEPMSDNTLQFKWIVTLHGNIDGMFRDNPNIFVAGDLLWYPVEGDNKTRIGPDVLVAFGRPKGERGSYRQWEEGGIAPQVIFEVLPPSNRMGDLMKKFQFYERFGVEEYFIYDPDRIKIEGYLRNGNALVDIPEMDGWVSPRLGIRFDMGGEELVVYHPNGERFLTYREILDERKAQFLRAEEQSRRADDEKQRAEEERLARLQAQQRADLAQQRADLATQRAEKLAEKLRQLGVDPD